MSVPKSKSVGRANLVLLARHLRDNVPADKFNMTYWGIFNKAAAHAPKRAVRWAYKRHYVWNVGSRRERHAVRNLNMCGTTACALGWGTTEPTLRRQGLALTTITQYKNADVTIVRDGVVVRDGAYEVSEELFGCDARRTSQMFFIAYHTRTKQRILTPAQAASNIFAVIREMDAREEWSK